MLGWIFYGALLAMSLATNVVILGTWWAMKKQWRLNPQAALNSFLEGAGMQLRNAAIVFDERGHFEIVPVVKHADHVQPGEST